MSIANVNTKACHFPYYSTADEFLNLMARYSVIVTFFRVLARSLAVGGICLLGFDYWCQIGPVLKKVEYFWYKRKC